MMCSYWLLNSTLGFYIVHEYPSLKQSHPLTYLYLILFSAKWLLAAAIVLGLMFMLCVMLKCVYREQQVIQNNIGVVPVLYIMTIVVSYLVSFYYGVVIMEEIYLYKRSV